VNDKQDIPEKQPPQPTDTVDNTASPLKRLAASFIDIFLVLIFVQPFLEKDMQVLIQKNTFVLSPDLALKILMYEVLVFFALNMFFLYRHSQTIGKRVMNIAIRDLQNQKPHFANLILNRYLVQIPMMIVPLLNIVDISFILIRKDRRCIHDLIAKTKVVDLRIQTSVTPNSLIA
jgi:uncharacterized RDD family membrane protein YckC